MINNAFDLLRDLKKTCSIVDALLETVERNWFFTKIPLFLLSPLETVSNELLQKVEKKPEKISAGEKALRYYVSNSKRNQYFLKYLQLQGLSHDSSIGEVILTYGKELLSK